MSNFNLLYVGSNPEGSDTLALDREITEIQRKVERAASAGSSNQIRFFPALAVEELATEIFALKPNVLHISAHGDKQSLQLSNANKAPVLLKPAVLRALLDTDSPPSIVYLNACNSIEVAKGLADLIPFAIGTTAPVSNLAARASAVRFYEMLMTGHSLERAFNSSQALLELMSEGKASSELCVSRGFKAKRYLLTQPLRIIARFGDSDGPDFSRDGDKYSIQLGVVGCPSDAFLAIFSTDDKTFEDDEGEYNPILGWTNSAATKGRIWNEDQWTDIYGDFRVCVSVQTASGRIVASCSTACEALKYYHSIGGYGKLADKDEKKFALALESLTAHAD